MSLNWLACKMILYSKHIAYSNTPVLIWVMCVSKAIRVKLIRFFFQIPEFLIVCITIYKWGTNKIFNNTRMVTGFTGFRRWLARLRVSSHILLSPVKTLFTMLVMLNTITSSCVNWVFFGMSGPTSAKKSPIYIRTSWIQSFFVRRSP
jgi:hypothetical protein